MQHTLKLVRAKASELARHPLFTDWLEDDGVAPEHKLTFVPMAIDFVMGFRDFNKYYVHYPEPVDARQATLNAHAAEDATHSALFVKDWASLDVDRLLGWAPRDLYWWMTSERTEAARRLDFELTALTYHNPDPLLRFAIIESMEAAGNVFFTRTVPVAEALEARIERPLPYFGRFHLARETGHLQSGDERVFSEVTLSVEARAHAGALVGRVFEIFHRHFDLWLALAREVRERGAPLAGASEARACAAVRPDRPADVSAYLSLEHPADLDGEAAALARRRSEAYEELWGTPFYQWVREAWPGDFGRTIRYFLLQWIVDNWTCADYFAFDTTYSNPATPLERGINRLSTLYGSEMNRRYVEWEILRFDEYTGWSARQALEHYWLDERVEEHRKVFADLRKLTFRYPKPLHRYWIMKCFVRFGDALMHSLGVSMRRAGVRDEDFITFAGAPERLHPDLPPDPEADRAIATLEHQPMAPEDVEIVRRIIEETRAQEAERSAISWRIVQERRYERLDARWQSRRTSVLPAVAE